MGKVMNGLRLARTRARQRRATARRRWKNMSLRTAFVWYVLIAAVLATFACAVIINLLDEYRVSLYFKYQNQAQEIPIPEGGYHRLYVSTSGSEVYIVYGPDDEIVQRGEIAYGEGTIEIGIGEDSDSYSLFITPEYSNADRFWNRVCAVLQAAAIPIKSEAKRS